jgi:beta-N-acetylhexosaminidase
MRPENLGDLFFIGIQGTECSPELFAFLDELRPGGVILFARNIESPEQLFDLVRGIRTHGGQNPLISIDQEGGTVDRMSRIIPETPTLLSIGATGDPALARLYGRVTGEILSSFGITANFSPVIDLALRPDDNGLLLRWFGSDPEKVALFSREYLYGLDGAGVQGCIKHFPGLGGSVQDSHATLPVIPTKKKDLHELGVYRELVSIAPMVMVGHGYYSDLTRDGVYPASISKEVVGGLLREEIRYPGVVLTDDLDMGAALGNTIEDNVEMAIHAGADFMLICRAAEKSLPARDRILACLNERTISQERIDQSLSRIEALKGQAPECPASFSMEKLQGLLAELQSLNERIAAAAVTLVHGKKGRATGRNADITLLLPKVSWLKNVAGKEPGWISRSLRELADAGRVDEIWYGPDDPLSEIVQRLGAPGKDRGTILATYHAHLYPYQRQLADEVRQKGHPLLHVALGLPEDIPGELTQVSLACYGCGRSFIQAAFRVLAGKTRAAGRNPVLTR